MRSVSLLVACFVIAVGADNRQCRQLYKAILNLRDDAIAIAHLRGEENNLHIGLSMIQSSIKADPMVDSEMLTFACKIANAKSVSDLAEITETEPNQQGYRFIVNRQIPMARSMLEKHDEWLEMAAKFLCHSGFPIFPLQITVEEAGAALEDIGYQMMRSLVPTYNPQKTDAYAIALAESWSLEEFAYLTNSTKLIPMYQKAVEQVDIMKNLVSDQINILMIAESMGLFSLPMYETSN